MSRRHPAPRPISIDWTVKLQHLLQVLAFCTLVATLLYASSPERTFAVPLVYSLTIGTITWAVIDFGRHLFASSAATGWPGIWVTLLLVLAGVGAGYLLGSLIADALCVWFGLYPTPRATDQGAIRRSSILVSLLAGVACTYWFYSRGRSAWLERRMGDADRQAREARLKLLETQLEPHMLFNTLANLRALIGQDPGRAQQMLDNLIDYLRATLDASRTSTHPLGAEFERLRDYLQLMSIRMGERLSFTLDLPAELAQQPVPTLLLQPLVENSIQHGLEPKIGGGSIHVTARRAGPTLLLEVADTGVGFAGTPAPGRGFGLEQVRERLQTLYGASAAMEFAATPGAGAAVTVQLPATT